MLWRRIASVLEVGSRRCVGRSLGSRGKVLECQLVRRLNSLGETDGQYNSREAAMTFCPAPESRLTDLAPAHARLDRRLLGVVHSAQLRAQSISPPSKRAQKRYIFMPFVYTQKIYKSARKKRKLMLQKSDKKMRNFDFSGPPSALVIIR